jgi:hypothetical protein
MVAVLKVDYVEPFFDVRYWLLRSLRVLAAELAAEADGGGESKAQRRTTTAAVFKLLMLVTVPKTETEITSFFVPFIEEQAKGAGAGQGQGQEEEEEEEEEAGEEDFLDFDYGDDEDDGATAEQEEDGDEGGVASPSSDTTAGVPQVARLSAHRKALGEAWLVCLRLELTQALYRSTTQFVARHVVDAMLNPLQVCDVWCAVMPNPVRTGCLDPSVCRHHHTKPPHTTFHHNTTQHSCPTSSPLATRRAG